MTLNTGQPDAAPYRRVIERPIAAAGATVDTTTVIGVCDEDQVVSAVTYIPASTVTGADTNTRTITLTNKSNDASGSTSVASLALTSGHNLTGLVQGVVTVSGTAANLETNNGDVLVFTSTHAASGLADPGGLLRVVLDRR